MIFRPSLTKSSLLLNKTKCCKIPCTDIFSPQVSAVFFTSLPTIFSNYILFQILIFLFKCIFNEVEFTSVARGTNSVLMSQSESWLKSLNQSEAG